jgi:hypothetical protein
MVCIAMLGMVTPSLFLLHSERVRLCGDKAWIKLKTLVLQRIQIRNLTIKDGLA